MNKVDKTLGVGLKGERIVVSQFTLYADTRKGRRPSFIDAALPEVASPLVDRFAELLRGHCVPTQTGQFGAHMEVEFTMMAYNNKGWKKNKRPNLIQRGCLLFHSKTGHCCHAPICTGLMVFFWKISGGRLFFSSWLVGIPSFRITP